MIGPLEALRALVMTRWHTRPGLGRARFEKWQARRLQRWLKHSLPKVGYYPTAPDSLSDLPLTDKTALMAQFALFNTRAVTVDRAWDIQANGGRHMDLTIGASTGTSGNRGLFIISEREKHRWLGTILAKAMADLLTSPQRVAIILPQDTGLYESANKMRFVQLRFFDLRQGPENWRTQLEAFAPTIVVAPPKILRHFAQERFDISPVRLFSAAETLDPSDRKIIEAHFARPLDQIYMATEGLFAVTCRHGSLHLCEDSVFFEFEPIGDGLSAPIVTCFQRQTQIMARYRMNDLMRLSDRPCPCGSPLRVVDEIVGRMDDVFRFNNAGVNVLLTPDILRNAVLDADRRITDFRLLQTSPVRVELQLSPDLPQQASAAAERAVSDLLAQRNTGAALHVVRADLGLQTDRKLRRVECRIDGAIDA